MKRNISHLGLKKGPFKRYDATGPSLFDDSFGRLLRKQADLMLAKIFGRRKRSEVEKVQDVQLRIDSCPLDLMVTDDFEYDFVSISEGFEGAFEDDGEF